MFLEDIQVRSAYLASYYAGGPVSSFELGSGLTEDRVQRYHPARGTVGGEAVTAYAYDGQDHLVAVTDAEGNTTTYAWSFSDRDLLTEEVSPVAGTTSYAYNEHGQSTSETDARRVTVLRTVDELDRVTFVDTPDPTLDKTYVYDDLAVSFSLGRLTAIERGGATVDYAYDRFGRVTQDGALTYAYDENGNRAAVGYPGGVSATYGYDFADRAASLAVQVGADPPQTVVSSAGYLPSGPLASLALGNGLAEQRGFDGRYVPARIEVPGLLDAVYTTDGVGNVLAVDRDGLGASFAYQDVHYFLTESRGPWPARAWTYDRIGNRLTEGLPGSDGDETLTYTYGINGTGGNTPQLLSIEPAPGVGAGSVDLGYDAAGDQTSWSGTRPEGAGVESTLISYGDDRRMSRIEDAGGAEATDLVYDGRSSCARPHRTLTGSTDFVRTEAVYSSEGVLHLRTRRRW